MLLITVSFKQSIMSSPTLSCYIGKLVEVARCDSGLPWLQLVCRGNVLWRLSTFAMVVSTLEGSRWACHNRLHATDATQAGPLSV